ncbi:hypothetical protein K9N68_13655 [Kovacikia minuta CCNUW1]|uniref:hypothetical protein n=1 Tax=Kovacikia minuta TaxID=2931930 RepID=UPI001CCD3F54|nr:hypothetical protein [Kovacikia minuta]UBF28793.1 hypothetical protein K9N68_13655 [Kovacikia minuta CCNUW1]
MNCSMQDYLQIVTSHLHPNLVSAEALSHIQPLAQILPASSLAGFECRLGENQSGVDFQVRLPCLDQSLPEEFLATPAWQFLQDFYQDWASPNSSLRQEISNVGLEFDVNEQLSQIPIPCIFLQFRKETVLDTERLMQMVRLLNPQISPRVESNLRLCVDSLPTGATISHLGAMLSRSVDAIRVNIQRISPQELPDYLAQLGWSDQANTFSTLTSTLSKFVDFILLSFDVGDRVFPRIGLECFLNQQPYDNPDESQWQQFLDYLVEAELCTPDKKNSLLSWPGFSQQSSAPELWPANLSLGDRLLGSKAVSLFSRWISHIKVIYQPGYPLQAKAYLGFAHGWFDRDFLQQFSDELATAL